MSNLSIQSHNIKQTDKKNTLNVIEWFSTQIYGEFFVWVGIIIGQFSHNQDSQLKIIIRLDYTFFCVS